MSFSEASFENAVLEIFRDILGYHYYYGPEVERDYHLPLHEELLIDGLCEINPKLPKEAIDEAIYKLKNFESGSILEKNIHFMEYLQNGIEVNYYDGEHQRSTRVILIDYKNTDNNIFSVANQWTIEENTTKRADLIVFVNGMPLVVVELKSPSREETDASAAYRQLKNYMHEIPSLFVYNAFMVMSDQAYSKAGTITSSEDRFMEWKTKTGGYEDRRHASFDTLFEGMFEKKRLIDIIHNFICFSKEDKQEVKILSGYHQYFAVKKAIESTLQAVKTDGKGGVFWHTQGSGKSLSMVFYTKLLQQNLDSPTIVVITDRNDLDDQLFGQFAKCQNFLRQSPIQATSRKNLKELLDGREANGIFFSTMQKFEESSEALSKRRNIIVIADEAHRSQYGLEEKISKEGQIKIGAARIIRDSLPNATFIGFTGTPISKKDRSTREVFGDYIDIYDMTQAVADGATKPVYYESRVVNLKIDEDLLSLIDNEYDKASEDTSQYIIDKSKREMGRLESILGSEQTINTLCDDILSHYEEFRQYEQTGKVMIVAYSRTIAMKIYERMLELRPSWGEKLAIVMTSSNDDPEEWRKIIGNKKEKDELSRRFKNDDDSLKIVIVVDMWLTGFDVPSLSTMYVYKPMNGHNLMQAIARVNRVYKDKVGGLVVDYVGIAPALKQAMSDYTIRDQQNYGDQDISSKAYNEFLNKLEVCKDSMHGFEYKKFLSGSDLQRARLISGGVNFLSEISRGNIKQTFVKEAMLLHNFFSLCKSIVGYDQRIEAAYFEAVRTLITRIEGKGGVSIKEINKRINDLLAQSIKSEGVINLFSDIKEEFSLFDPKFLHDIANIKERNIAVELLKKLIAEQIYVYQKTNVVKSEKFSEILSRAMSNYLKGMLTNEQVIEELLKMAHDIINAKEENSSLGLDDEEQAFYDALTKPDAVKDFFNNEQLIAITKELTESLQKNKTIDWQKKETARAGMRKMIKRLLAKYNYPPEKRADALETVYRQCEMWADR
ncbi:MAG: type site-specific deoxyribonuclease, HsdR family [Bacteroidetes bacterium]|nr:type site-specific deoxyribonuclease, HsdR family [Bacteroidota bacterium]